jgi:glycine dehydrogenase
MSLVLLESPGKFGADVVVGSTQRFGIPLGYGGPHAAYFASKEQFKRNIPGRIIGQTRDLNENSALRMALQTREQHIKRDRATSNICTAQVLLAVMAGMYAVYHGPEGLRYIAENIHQKTVALNNKINSIGFIQKNRFFFDTLQIEADASMIKPLAESNKINFYYPDSNTVCISLNETTSEQEIDLIVAVFEKALDKLTSKSDNPIQHCLPKNLIRETPYLKHSVFNCYHSETALMRYIKSLERKDLALNHSMISLGSCTMKLNAASEMLPLSDPNWGSLHPFVPKEQVLGYQKMLAELVEQLNEVTGFAASSLQPNSGAQGEYAGLMVIRAYHESRGDLKRKIMIIPSSAHGTNPASAVMAGFKVVVTSCDENGNINVDELQKSSRRK